MTKLLDGARRSDSHAIAWLGGDNYRISWSVTYKVAGKRYTDSYSQGRLTDRKGAQRFAKRHGLSMPTEIVVGPNRKAAAEALFDYLSR